MLEEYGAEFVHIAGEHNVIADALSRLDARWADDAYDKFDEVPELTFQCHGSVSNYRTGNRRNSLYNIPSVN